MKSQVWVYVSVVILSIGAGVAIAGIPESAAQEPRLPLPSTTEVIGQDDAAPGTESVVTEPIATEPAGTTAPETTIESSTTTTTTTSSTTTTTTTTTTVPLPDRSEVPVRVANGANVGGSATRVSNALEELGYVDVRSFDGDVIVDVTAIYAAEGFEGPAERLSEEVGLEPGLVFPIEVVPDVPGLGTSTRIVLYLGRDVESLPIYG